MSQFHWKMTGHDNTAYPEFILTVFRTKTNQHLGLERVLAWKKFRSVFLVFFQPVPGNRPWWYSASKSPSHMVAHWHMPWRPFLKILFPESKNPILALRNGVFGGYGSFLSPSLGFNRKKNCHRKNSEKELRPQLAKYPYAPKRSLVKGIQPV